MAVRTTGADRRVCTSCGDDPGSGTHCAACGVNLIWRPRLPTRGEWERRNGGPPESEIEPLIELRYSARDLNDMHRGPRRVRRGRLVLLLSINEYLGRDEDPLAFFDGYESPNRRCWLVLTPAHLMCVPERPAASLDSTPPTLYPLDTIEQLHSRSVLLRSYLSLKMTDGESIRYGVRGRNSAPELESEIEALKS